MSLGRPVLRAAEKENQPRKNWRRYSTGRFRILHLITRGDVGGAQSHVLALSRYLGGEFDVHAAMGEKGELWEKLKKDAIPLYHLPHLVRDVCVADVPALLEIVRLLRTVKPDLLAIHSSKAGILGRIAARICGVPAVYTAHGWAFTDGVPDGKKRLHLFAERKAAGLAEKIICVSDFDLRLAKRLLTEKEGRLIAIHNGIPDMQVKKTDRPKYGPARLIMVGRFAEPKDQQMLIRAAGEIRAKVELLVDLVGSGPQMEKCRMLARDLNMENKINFLGQRSDVDWLLAKADIFLLVSKWEGLPYSILEAMRAALPVIASDVGGVGEAVSDGVTGYLVPRNDLETLKDRIIRLINYHELRDRMGSAGREKILRKFTIDCMISQTASVYREILEKNQDHEMHGDI